MSDDYDVLTVCLSPTLQRTLVFASLNLGGVNRAEQQFLSASGKGVNAARVACQVGARARHLCQLGGCQGPLFLDLCAADGIKLITCESGCEIRTCSTLIDRSSGQCTEVVEESPKVAPTAWPRLLDLYKGELAQCRVIVISGKPAGGFPEHAHYELAKLALASDRRLVLDLRAGDLIRCLGLRAAGKIIFKPNLQEFCETFGLEPEKPRMAARHKLTELLAEGCGDFLLTDGPRPAILATNGRIVEIDIGQVDVRNPIGSGDACAAGIAVSLARGFSIEQAARYGLELGTSNAKTLRPGWVLPEE